MCMYVSVCVCTAGIHIPLQTSDSVCESACIDSPVSECLNFPSITRQSSLLSELLHRATLCTFLILHHNHTSKVN